MNVKRTFIFSLAGLFLLLLNACNNPSAPKEVVLKHADGSLKRRYTLVDSLIEGEMTEYYPGTGALQVKRIFVKGVQSGRTQLFYPDGKLKEVQYYQNGKKQGGDTIFYPNGDPQFVVTFKDGKMHGPMRKWDEDGKLFFEARYERDSLIEVTKKMEALPKNE